MSRQCRCPEQTDDDGGKQIYTNLANARKADRYTEAKDLRQLPFVEVPPAPEQAELTHLSIEHGKRGEAHGQPCGNDR